MTTRDSDRASAGEPDVSGLVARLMQSLARRSRRFHAGLTLLLVLLVGAADYLTGFERSLLVFYILPIALGVWFVDRSYGITLSILSFGIWLLGDFAAGALDTKAGIVGWNAAIGLVAFLIVVWLLSTLRRLLSELESRVVQRTAALSREMRERERLEREILEVSEREQSRIGHDLHDGLGQHLTGAALTGQLLSERLMTRGAKEAPEAERVVALINEAIEITRSLAHGLSPVALNAEGLVTAFQDLRAYAAKHFQVICDLECETAAVVVDPAAATHLYRIAQEAITNAVRHGGARAIEIRLNRDATNATTLEVADDGVGIPESTNRGRAGLGLRAMAHRAELMGATFWVRRRPEGGTMVHCSVPSPGDSAKVRPIDFTAA